MGGFTMPRLCLIESYAIAEWSSGPVRGYLAGIILPPMSTSVAVHGREITDIVNAHPKGIRLSQLVETANRRFGPAATFHTNSRLGLGLDELLVFLEARHKLRIVRGVI